jgi:hypothetical protein
LILSVALAPLRVAVTVAEALLVMAAVDAAKVAVVELAGTVTEAGTVRAALLDDKPTVVLPERVAFDRVTVQVVLLFAARLEAVHCRDERLTGP